jgi:hypothetical protein
MVFSPDDGHIVALNMWRKAINILRKIVHQVGSIYMIIQRGCFLMVSFVPRNWLLSCRDLAGYSFTNFAASFFGYRENLNGCFVAELESHYMEKICVPLQLNSMNT